MDDKPIPGPWFLSRFDGDWGLPGVFYIHTAGDPMQDMSCVVASVEYDTPYAFGDPVGRRKFAQKKATAELLFRAQHMGELVEAVRGLLGHSAFDTDPSDTDEEDKAKERRVRAILAQIGGGV